MLGGDMRVVQSEQAALGQCEQAVGNGGQATLEATPPIGAAQLGKAIRLADDQAAQLQHTRLAQ
jgi:hypothetical protein